MHVNFAFPNIPAATPWLSSHLHEPACFRAGPTDVSPSVHSPQRMRVVSFHAASLDDEHEAGRAGTARLRILDEVEHHTYAPSDHSSLVGEV